MRSGDKVKETTEFKKWFDGSKVVDAEGHPLLVYHGSPNEFSVFDYKRIRSRNEGAGFYFTNNRDVACGYGTPMEVYLSIRNPMAYDAKPFDRATIEKIVRRIADLQAQAHGIDIADGFLSSYGDIRSDGLAAVVKEAVRLIAADESALDQLSDFVGSGVPPEYVNRAALDVTGHDGIVSDGFSGVGDADNRIFVAFFPEQIMILDPRPTASAEAHVSSNTGSEHPEDPPASPGMQP